MCHRICHVKPEAQYFFTFLVMQREQLLSLAKKLGVKMELAEVNSTPRGLVNAMQSLDLGAVRQSVAAGIAISSTIAPCL